MATYSARIENIPPEKMSEFHELCDGFGFEITNVQYEAFGKKPIKVTRKKQVRPSAVPPGTRKYTKNDKDMLVQLNTKKQPGRGMSLKAWNALADTHGLSSFTYEQAKLTIKKHGKLSHTNASDCRKNLLRDGYLVRV